MMEAQDTRVPVTLLTGFLGAGKTTLLNHLIRDPQAGRVAVVMNEFGDIALDHDLIEEATEETVLLQSGCVCCSMRGDLGKTLGSLIERRGSGELVFNRLVIETTGLADPGPVLRTLTMDDTIAPHFRMDGIVTVADAANGPVTLEQQFEAVNQIAMADLIIVTKTDCVTPAEAERFDARLDRINSTAQRVRADRGRVPSGTLFGLSALHADATREMVAGWLGASTPGLAAAADAKAPKSANDHAHHGHGHGHHHNHGDHGHSHHHDHHNHESRIGTAFIEVREPIPASVFDVWFDTLIMLRGPDILRMKGIVHVEGMEWPFVFHVVQHTFDPPVPLKSWSGNDTTSRVVVIARDMDEKALKANLEALRTPPSVQDPAGVSPDKQDVAA